MEGQSDFALMSNEALGEYAQHFLAQHAGISPSYDPNYDDADERWTGPDSALLDAAAQALLAGRKPSIVHSDWGSGTYRGWNNITLKAEHDALVKEINARANGA